MSNLLTKRPYDSLKRALDVAGAAVGLILTLPVQAGVALAVASKLGRPVLFKQKRPGLDGEVFTLYKFRTMKDVDHGRGLTTNAQRLTPFGIRLRSTSLDELPSLINVLLGDMSMVGPRPLLTVYLDRYSDQQARRHEVRPGLTGLAQVSGRNSITWENKFDLDVRYVDGRSLCLDANILFRTISTVVRRQGITSQGEVNAVPFTGTETIS